MSHLTSHPVKSPVVSKGEEMPRGALSREKITFDLSSPVRPGVYVRFLCFEAACFSTAPVLMKADARHGEGLVISLLWTFLKILSS